MNILRTHRELARARASAAAPPSSASLKAIVAAANGRLDVSLSSPRDRPVKLEEEAAAFLEVTRVRLPDPLQSELAVEAGEVRALLCRDGGEVPLFSRSYHMASCRGVVLGIGEAVLPFKSPWTGTLAAEEIDSSLAVILTPSAVLALVSYALEVAGSHVASRGESEIPGVTVIDTASSPYPPQHHPFEADGTASPDRPLIAEGCWCDRGEHAGDDVDPLFFLLTRPERALRPLAAATHFNRRNLAVRCSQTVPFPSPSILIDSWRVRVGPRSGVVPFHAYLSRSGPNAERLALASAVTLRCDPWELLTQVRGASGAIAPAIDEDPIEGDSYGVAPTLVTGLTLADLISAEKA